MSAEKTNKAKEEDPGFRVEDRRVSSQTETGDDPPSATEESAPTEEPTHETSRFSRFMASLHMTALYHLGQIPGPSGERPQPNPQLARENIDIMEELQKKTAGNLTEEEDQLVKHLLVDARKRYLQATMAGV
jgi:hypothetical protein